MWHLFFQMSRSVYFVTQIILEKLIGGLKLQFQVNIPTHTLEKYLSRHLTTLLRITLLKFL